MGCQGSEQPLSKTSLPLRLRSPNVALRPTRRAVLAALLPALTLMLAQISQLSRIPISVEPDIRPTLPETSPDQKRFGVVTFVDSKDSSLWGVYSIHKQLEKFRMTPSVTYVALIASEMKPKSKALLAEWLGPENVREIDQTFIRRKVDESLWDAEFSKLEFFNMTEFDKLIAIDYDVLIRRSLMHWFDFPAPAAPQEKGTVGWHTGTMVIEPNTRLYRILLEYISKAREWKVGADHGSDTWNSADTLQGFLSSFFTSNVTSDRMFTMGYPSAVHTDELNQRFENHYFWKFRKHAIETVQFTSHKPWKQVGGNRPLRDTAVCDVFREWLESVSDAPDRLPELLNRLKKCRIYLGTDGPS